MGPVVELEPDWADTDTAAGPDEIEIVDVEVKLGRVQWLGKRHGGTLALFDVLICLRGVTVKINGCTLSRLPSGQPVVKVPNYQTSKGVWRRSVEIEQSLMDTVAELLAEEQKRQRVVLPPVLK
jgi:hypothetical protein